MSARVVLSAQEHRVLCASLYECHCEAWRLWGRRADVSDAHNRDVLRAAAPSHDGFVSFEARS